MSDPLNIPQQSQQPAMQTPVPVSPPPNKSLQPIIIVFGALLLLAIGGAGGYYLAQPKQISLPPSSKACPADAKLCPDGSTVGRTGPNCEFASCPTQTATQQVDKTYTKDFPDPKFLYPFPVIKYPSTWTFTRQSMEGTADQQLIFTDSSGAAQVVAYISSMDFLSGFYTPQQAALGKLQQVTINALTAYHIQNQKTFVDGYFFPARDGYVAIELVTEAARNAWQQMVNTFSFDQTVGYGTYNNTAYNYTFKYPNTFSFVSPQTAETDSSVALKRTTDLTLGPPQVLSVPIIEADVQSYLPQNTSLQAAFQQLKAPEYNNINSIKNITANMQSGIQFVSTNTQAGSGKPNLSTLLQLKNGSVLIISLLNYQVDQNALTAYQEVLNTFSTY